MKRLQTVHIVEYEECFFQNRLNDSLMDLAKDKNILRIIDIKYSISSDADTKKDPFFGGLIIYEEESE